MTTAKRDRLLRELDAAIREHEGFLASHSIETEAAAKRLAGLRDARAKLLVWKQPESCSCSRGGRALFCEHNDWPDMLAERALRACEGVA